MTTQKKQPISGVSASGEVEIRWRYPSIAATGLGRLIGQLCDLIPVRIWGIKLSAPLALALAPLGVLEYARLKLLGERYVLTNRSVQRWGAFGNRQIQSVPLIEVAEIEVAQQSGQEFYHAGDVTLIGAKGNVLMRLPGVPRPEVFRENILKARDARTETEKALATIAARHR